MLVDGESCSALYKSLHNDLSKYILLNLEVHVVIINVVGKEGVGCRLT